MPPVPGAIPGTNQPEKHFPEGTIATKRRTITTRLAPLQRNTVMTPFKLRNSHLPIKEATLLLLGGTISAQPSLPSSPVEAGLAGSVVARVESPWLARSNPAAVATAPTGTFGASFSPSNLGIEGFYEGYALAALPIDSLAGIGAAVQGVGAGGYREISGSCIGAVTLGETVRLGAALTVRSLAIDRYGAATAATIDLGAIAWLSDRIRFGGMIANINRAELAGAGLPERVAVGFAFDIGSSTALSIDAWQELRRSAGLAMGLSTSPAPGLTIRGGAGSGPGTMALGVGYTAGDITIEYGGAYVVPVGFRHVIGAGIGF